MKEFFVGVALSIQSMFGTVVDGTFYVTDIASDLFTQAATVVGIIEPNEVEVSGEQQAQTTKVSASVMPRVVYTDLPYTLVWDVEAEFISIVIQLDGVEHQTIPCLNRQSTAIGEVCDLILTKGENDPVSGYESYFIAHSKDEEVARFSLGQFELYHKEELTFQTYEDTEIGYTLQYPSDWKATTEKDGVRFAGPKSDRHSSVYVSSCEKTDCADINSTATVTSQVKGLYRTDIIESQDNYIMVSYGVYDESGLRSQAILRIIAESIQIK